jgi:hypothetical protein
MPGVNQSGSEEVPQGYRYKVQEGMYSFPDFVTIPATGIIARR